MHYDNIVYSNKAKCSGAVLLDTHVIGQMLINLIISVFYVCTDNAETAIQISKNDKLAIVCARLKK